MSKGGRNSYLMSDCCIGTHAHGSQVKLFLCQNNNKKNKKEKNNGDQERDHYLCEGGIEKSVPSRHTTKKQLTW